MAKKKKTMVVMPGAMTDLAHRVQKGQRPNPTTNSEETTMNEQEVDEPVQYDTNNVDQEVHTQVEEQQPEEYAELLQMLMSQRQHLRRLQVLSVG